MYSLVTQFRTISIIPIAPKFLSRDILESPGTHWYTGPIFAILVFPISITILIPYNFRNSAEKQLTTLLSCYAHICQPTRDT